MGSIICKIIQNSVANVWPEHNLCFWFPQRLSIGLPSQTPRRSRVTSRIFLGRVAKTSPFFGLGLRMLSTWHTNLGFQKKGICLCFITRIDMNWWKYVKNISLTWSKWALTRKNHIKCSLAFWWGMVRTCSWKRRTLGSPLWAYVSLFSENKKWKK